MHIHLSGRSPCSVLPVEQLINEISPKIDAICITDHWILDPIKYLTYYEPKVFYGVEITTDLGDILAYGIQKVPSRNLRAEEAINLIHKQGGIAICPHPFSTRHIAFDENIYDFKFDAIEINGAVGKKGNEMARKAALIMDLPTIGGSDAHSVKQLNTIVTRFKTSISSLKDIIRAVKSKKCKAIRI